MTQLSQLFGGVAVGQKTKLLHVEDQKVSGVEGGTFTAGVWQTRALNTVVTNEIAGAGLSSNQITLPEGDYYFEIAVPAQRVDHNKAKLYNVTDSSDIKLGTVEITGNADSVSNKSFISGKFSLSASKILEVRHRCQTTQATDGFGSANSSVTGIEIYTKVKIWKIESVSTQTSLLSTRNAIINGDMRIAQRGTSFTSISSGSYGIDRFVYNKNGTMVHTLTQDTSVPGDQFGYSAKFAVTTAQASIGASDNARYTQHIEGYNFKRFVGKEATLSFWVKSSKTGTMCVAFGNKSLDRTYIAEIHINSSNSWEKKTVTLTFDYSGGTWDYTNGKGLSVSFILAMGSTYQTSTTGSWLSGTYLASSNQTNFCDSTSNNVWITGVQLELGDEATDFEFVDFESELSMCQRYYYHTYSYGTYPGATSDTANGRQWYAQSTVQGMVQISYPSVMRANPTKVVYNPNTGVTSSADIAGTARSASPSGASSTGTTVYNTTNATGWMSVHLTADAEL